MDTLTYSGTDWREALSRNVTVSLEFAERDLADRYAPDPERALALVREALAECRRLLAAPNVEAP